MLGFEELDDTNTEAEEAVLLAEVFSDPNKLKTAATLADSSSTPNVSLVPLIFVFTFTVVALVTVTAGLSAPEETLLEKDTPLADSALFSLLIFSRV